MTTESQKIEALLNLLTVECYSNQHGFTNTKRIQRIEHQLVGSAYHMVLRGKLFDLYGKKNWETLMSDRQDLLIISTHIDCVRSIDRFWSEYKKEENRYYGTYDNAITNAVILKLMLQDELPDHVLIAFTGEEETSLLGARELAKVFKEARGAGGISIVTLDVTYEGYDKDCSFVIENAFDRFDEHFYRKIFRLSEATGKEYEIVPPYTRSKHSKAYQEIEEMDTVLEEMHLMHKLADHAADGDESIEYHFEGMECFSFCLPCDGEMHDTEGVCVKGETLEQYERCLADFLKKWYMDEIDNI